MPDGVWKSYTGKEAGQIVSGLQVLLEGKVLGREEEGLARSIQRRLERTTGEGLERHLVSFSEKENELLTQVEGVLWT